MNIEIIRREVDLLRLSHPELVEDEDAWALSLESETDFVDVLRQIERKRQDSASMAGALAGNIAAIEERQKRFERREQAMRKLAFNLMQAANVRRQEFAEATYSVATGKPKVIITDESAVPDSLCRIKREPDKKLIREQLESGAVAGAVFSNAEMHLTIRTK